MTANVQILVDGFFHADPHPGNIILTDDKKIGILDLGMVGRIGPMFQKDLLSLLLAISEGRSEDAATQAIKMGTRRQDFNEEAFRRKVSHIVLSNKDAALGELDVGGIMVALTRVAGACGLRPPLEVAMIGKTLLNLDQVVTTLDPAFEPAEVVREESASLLRSNIGRGLSQGNVSASILEILKFGELLPSRLGKVLDVVGGNEFRLKVDTVDEKLLIQGMQKIANRIAMGVILASLIIGAAQMMRVETSWRILEYPGLAILLFGAALFGCVALILTILRSDDHSNTSARKLTH